MLGYNGHAAKMATVCKAKQRKRALPRSIAQPILADPLTEIRSNCDLDNLEYILQDGVDKSTANSKQ